MGSIKIDN